MVQNRPTWYQSAACHMIHGATGNVDHDQLSPLWTSFEDLTLISKVELIAPVEVYRTIREKILQHKTHPNYYHFLISLGQLLHSRPLVQLIRDREIFMFSEGDSMFATTYSIKDGIVTIHMEKEIFERAGLPGKPLVDNIRGNGQARWVVSMDLGSLTTFPDGRVPDSLLHACSTVLTERSLWLFCLKNGSALNEKLWEALQINQCSITSRLSQKTLALPELILTAPPAATDGVGFEERAIATYEWLSLVRLESPRIEPKDAIDPYLSRYYIKGKTSDPLHICKITWQGLIGTSWLRDLARDAMALCPQQDWFSIIATKSCCIEMGIHAESVLLRPSGNGSQYLLWQIDRHR